MVRFAGPRIAGALLICSLVCGASASAQELPAPTLRLDSALPDPAVLPTGASSTTASALAPFSPRRPRALVPLYLSFGTLQILDTHSTSRALAAGGSEANPLLKGIVENEVGLLAVKAAGTAGVIYASEKLWKKNKAAAIVFMVAANSAMAWVVQNNYRAVR